MIIKFAPAELFAAMPPANPAPVPIGDPVSQIAVRGFASQAAATTRTGVWECSPGRWRRQVLAAEFCVFLEGECVFEPDDGEPIRITPGEAVYFPANTAGIWTIETKARKAYVIFDEAR